MAGEQAANTAMLSHRHIFGLKGDVSRLVHFVEESQVVYPCGHNIVLYNTETKEQELIHGMVAPPIASEGITAMAVTPNRKYMAVAERSERGVVNIYDIASKKRRKMLAYPELGSKEIVHVSFSGDSKLCLTMGGAPEWTLVAWTFDRGAKPVAVTKVSQQPSVAVSQADFCPQDSTAICCTGNGILRFFRLAENQFRPIAVNQKREPASYVAHCWLPEERMVTATEQGEILLFENFEFRMALSSSAVPGHEEATRLESIVAYSKGFVCGGRHGCLRIYERSEDVREYYKCQKVFNVQAGGCAESVSITNLVISPSEETLICATNENQMYTFSLSNTDILKEDSMNNFELLSTSFHGPGPTGSAQIHDMDVCVWKPLVVTCGADHTVRVWNYMEKSVELMKKFPDEEEPLSVALHPSGLYVLVGFSDKLRMMSLLMDDIRAIRELPVKACRVAAFSHGGQAFAVANNSVVQIYATYTCEVQANLRGHNGKIKAIQWSKNDSKLATVGHDGAVFLWKVREGAKYGEAMVPRCSFAGAGCAPDLSRLFCVAEDKTIREFVTKNNANGRNNNNSTGPAVIMGASSAALVSKEQQPPPTPSTTIAAQPAAATAAVVSLGKAKACVESMACAEVSKSGRLLFVGTSEQDVPGVVAVHPMITAQSRLDEWDILEAQRYQCHSSAVSCLKMSHDGLFLFSGGEDGSLCIFEVHDMDARGQVVRSAGPAARGRMDHAGAQEFTEEILVTKSDLEDKSNQMLSLRNKVEELVLNNEYQLRLKDMKYKERITEISDKFTSELDSDSERFGQLTDDKRRLELEYEDKLQSLEGKQKREFKDLESQYDMKISTEMTRYRALVAEREEENAAWDEENRELVDEHSRHVAELTVEYDEKIEQEHELARQLTSEKETVLDRSSRTKTYIEEDADNEIGEVKQKYEARLTAERQMTLRLKNENVHMKKRFSALTKDVEDQKAEIRSLHDKEKELVEAIKGLEKDILGHKKEIRERDETIADKDKRIYDLKKKNQELEKFKFVLDYKIKELKRQIEPRETEIADMRKQVEEMDMELEQYHKSNSALDLMIGELRLKMDGMAKEISQQKQILLHGTSHLARFRRELQSCAAHLDDHKQLKPRVVELYKQYVLQEGAAARAEQTGQEATTAGIDEPRMQQEYNRQREHLERNVEALKRKIAKDMKMYFNDHARLVDESTVLVDEMNNLRRESHGLQLKQQGLLMGAGGPSTDSQVSNHVAKLERRCKDLEGILEKNVPQNN